MPDIFDRLATSPQPTGGATGGDIFDRVSKQRSKETDPEKLFTPTQRANLKKTEDYIERNTPKGGMEHVGEFFSTLGKDAVGAAKAAGTVLRPALDPSMKASTDAGDVIKGI